MVNHYVFQKYDGLMVYFNTAMPREDIFTLFGTVDDDEFEEKLLTIQDLHVRSRTYNFTRDDLKNDGITCEVIQYVKIPRHGIVINGNNERLHIRPDSIIIDNPLRKDRRVFADEIIKAMCDAHEPFTAIDTTKLVCDGTAWARASFDDKGVFHVEPIPRDEVIVFDSMRVMPKKEVKKPFYRELEKKSKRGV